MNILLIDNRDSFVYNVKALIEQCNVADRVDVVPNDKIDFGRLGYYSGIVLSPGPGIPNEAADMPKLIDICENTHSILGICLGHQAIAEHFGAKLHNLPHPLHGKQGKLKVVKPEDILLRGLSCCETIGHYHSWVVAWEELPECIEVTATDNENNIMSFSHKSKPLYGLQFHPESFMTSCGKTIVQNWLLSLRSK
ncbi:MAG: aminodeoxychorismate/anthranilate synthase component II [Bacteroidales bacterium]|nr:aminodeoxychorismate/anthranilate synthase component II [Bacteroidales bacterium]MDY4932857.1 aminodeoxychorismate/anthranilate synthase component II [Candidatus Onthomorpha sp.]MCI6801271.1 aminodeoxychorismate/anthranilate synthase component II [Bacteroidales bacterium]MCI6900945.1 aminodeoxychorismate/anthranilate synthase component II [Bacteroidales bacterium]MCI7408305.1 aminodeoxychorismate/anthranilate synthase component II [Bacteroidales bacterium]